MRAAESISRYFLLGAALAAAAGCGDEPPSSFTTGSASGGQGQGGAGGGQGTDPELGGPCVEDAQCDDGLACTFDRCDTDLWRCRFARDDSVCQNGVHCDGAEICHQKLGCVAGPPPSCTDDILCTIDACVEATQSCTHAPRDADDDGDPDAHCGGGDCEDDDATISSLLPEVCANQRDDDCDGSADEAGCLSPQNDTCADPLIVTGTSSHQLSTAGATFDVPTTCAPPGNLGDVVVALMIPPGPAIDVVARARTDDALVSQAVGAVCGDPASELACGPSYSSAKGGYVSRVRARGIGGGAAETAFPLYVATAGAATIALDVTYEPASTAPTNETCGTAADLAVGVPTEVEIVDAVEDLASACQPAIGELVYKFTLAQPADVDVYAMSVDGDGWPSVSLRDADCALQTDEVACHTAKTAHVFRHALPAGDHYVSLGASAPTTVSLIVLTSAPTAPPPDEDCSSTATLTAGETVPVSFEDHQDDVALGCMEPAVDAAYGLSLTGQSDVLLVQRISAMDAGAVHLCAPGCAPADLVTCGFGSKSPVRARKRNVPAGDYRVVAESLLGEAQELTAFVRPYAPAVLVPFSDACADAQTIPETGGFFQGNTSNVTANFSAGCDLGGGPPNGAKEQLLKLELSAPRRVVLDMTGTGYDALLSVREGPGCPGSEVPLACTISFGEQKSFLDLDLDAGTYYVQVDGVGSATGAWVLDVHVVDP